MRREVCDGIRVGKTDIVEKYGRELCDAGERLLWKTTKDKKGNECTVFDSKDVLGMEIDDSHVDVV